MEVGCFAHNSSCLLISVPLLYCWFTNSRHGIQSFMQQVFTEDLLCTRHCSRDLEYSREQTKDPYLGGADILEGRKGQETIT